jgi:hypothetical protein
MKSSMDYGARTFGNTGSNAPSYTVKLSRSSSKGPIKISFGFDRPADGRGVGIACGKVGRVQLELPRGTAEALSHALQLALSDTASTDLQFTINEAVTSN